MRPGAIRLALSLLLAACVMPSLDADAPDRRLLDAVKRRDAKAVTALLRSKVDVNTPQPDGATALAWAVNLGERAMADALLAAGANVHATDEYGETALTLAAANGDAVLVEHLLAAGAHADASRWNGETALMIASGAGSLDVVKMLVLRGADVNAFEPRKRQTALMWAAAEGHSGVVRGLVEIGANPKAASSTGFSALMFSVTKNDVASIKILLHAGADPDTKLPSGNTALMVAMAYGHTDAGMALLDGGAAIDVRDRAGNTPLHIAAQQGDLVLVKALLARKADPNVRTPKSTVPAGGRGGGGFGRAIAGEQTPLMLAARNDREEVMRALVAAGADPSLKAQDGSNLLMGAAAGSRIQAFTYAYSLNPDVNVVASGNTTIMHIAVGLGGRTQPEVCEVVQFLADHGAALDELNGGGRTPIAVADNLPVDMAVALLTKLITERGGKPKIPSKR